MLIHVIAAENDFYDKLLSAVMLAKISGINYLFKDLENYLINYWFNLAQTLQLPDFL